MPIMGNDPYPHSCWDRRVFIFNNFFIIGKHIHSHLLITPNLNNPPLPTTTYTRMTTCKRSYTHFSRTLHANLLHPDTINKETCPRAYNELQSHRVNKDGFDILLHTVFQLSPHLGGSETTPETIVQSLTIMTGEALSEYHCRATEAYNEIVLQQNKTCQDKETIGKYLDQL